MQSKVRGIIIYSGMDTTKEEYRSKSKDIWTAENILINEKSINKNLRIFLGNSTETLMAYLAKDDEFNILPSIKDLTALQVPYMHKNKIHRCKYSNKLVLSDLGFPVPKIIKISSDVPDLIIIPGRFFDNFGNRIGRGKGHYDEFLANHMNATFVGVSLSQTLVRILPSNIQDIKMDIIVTEKGIFEFKK